MHGERDIDMANPSVCLSVQYASVVYKRMDIIVILFDDIGLGNHSSFLNASVVTKFHGEPLPSAWELNAG